MSRTVGLDCQLDGTERAMELLAKHASGVPKGSWTGDFGSHVCSLVPSSESVPAHSFLDDMSRAVFLCT